MFLFAKFSVMLVTCMGAERWFAIARPSRYRVDRTLSLVTKVVSGG